MQTDLKHYFLANGYDKIEASMPEVSLYVQSLMGQINMVQVLYCHDKLRLNENTYRAIKENLLRQFSDKTDKEIHLLHIIISDMPILEKPLYEQDDMCWIIDETTKTLMVADNQIEDFYGIRKGLEEVLAGTYDFSDYYKSLIAPSKKTNIPVVTIGIVALNVLFFLLCTFTGKMIYNIGEFNPIQVIYYHEYYRFLSCMFLHGSIMHLIGNMVLLWAVGELLEKELGPIRFFILYIGAGLASSIGSFAWDQMQHQIVKSIGASGAVFGLIGALLFQIIYNKGTWKDVTLYRIVVMITLLLYDGFAATNVDNAAHVVGLVSGFLIMILLCITKRKVSKDEN